MPLKFLQELLYESRQKWKEIKDEKRYLSMGQLFLAESFRWVFLLLLMFSILLTGVGSAGMATSDSFVSVQKYRWSDGSVSYERSGETCANIMCAVSFALFMAGVGCFIACLVCYLLALMFWGLSFIWAFQTDHQFEIKYAFKISELNNELNRIESTQPLHPDDASYMASFMAENARKEDEIRAKISALEDKRDIEREKRAKRSRQEQAVNTSGANDAQVVPMAYAKPLGEGEGSTDKELDEDEATIERKLAEVHEWEATHKVGIDKYLTKVGSAAAAAHVEVLFQSDMEVFPNKVVNLAKQRNVSEAEVTAALKRSMYSDFSEPIGEARSTARDNARKEIHAAVHQLVRVSSEAGLKPEEAKLFEEIRALNTSTGGSPV